MSSLAAFAPASAALRAPRRVAASSSSTSARRQSNVVVKAFANNNDAETPPLFNTRRAVLGAAVGAAMSAALGAATAGPANAKDGKNGVYWVFPRDGATVPKSFTVKMGVKGFELSPAADGFKEGTGHHHIVVDGAAVEKGDVIPFDATHIHFGKAQSEATIELAPGPHTLTLQFANHNHASYGKKFSNTINIKVE
eukprot:CAMPEP_0197606502 /NCGR_PEP_ID=MMETSP1326-20131121/45192_1 /TAXON_ID=1155430 /ORGANISM="Genus nov. species nov., Strain RCC2288" /LENGTH=195 /DNA_ID=CAMNT_0043174423 /DNA_START=88 /DNA_END=675 /DNA_ORIENTATION=-